MLFLCLTGYELCQPILIADVVKKKKKIKIKIVWILVLPGIE